MIYRVKPLSPDDWTIEGPGISHVWLCSILPTGRSLEGLNGLAELLDAVYINGRRSVQGELLSALNIQIDTRGGLNFKA